MTYYVNVTASGRHLIDIRYGIYTCCRWLILEVNGVSQDVHFPNTRASAVYRVVRRFAEFIEGENEIILRARPGYNGPNTESIIIHTACNGNFTTKLN